MGSARSPLRDAAPDASAPTRRHDTTSFSVPSDAAPSSRDAPRDASPPTPRPDASTIERGGAAPDASPLVTHLPTTPATNERSPPMLAAKDTSDDLPRGRPL